MQADTEQNRCDKMSTGGAIPDSHTDKTSNNTEKQGVVEQLIELVKKMGELFHDESGNAYITVASEGARKTYALQNSNFKEQVSYEYYRLNQRAVRAQQLTDAMFALSGYAKYEGPRISVFLRVAQDKERYLLDMCDDEWRAIRMSATNGVEIVNQPKHRFVRPNGALPLVLPDTSGNLDDLLQLVNIERSQSPLLVTAMCEFLRPETAYPMIEFVGEHGAGKSATQAAIRALFDPKDVSLRSAPRKEEDIFIAARNNHIVSYNNASHLSPDFQDAICTLSTGGGYASRKLYTDGEEHSYDVKRPVLINGILPVATQPDLLSRVVRINCPKISKRISDAELQQRFEQHAPKALGYVLRIFCEALNILPSIRLTDPPRLMDFAELGEAVSQSMGLESGTFINAYQESLLDAARGSIEGAPVIECLISYMLHHNVVEETVGGLLNILSTQSTTPPGWPKNARALRGELDRYRDALRHFDIHIEYTGQRRSGSKLIIRKGKIQTLSRPSPNSPLHGGCDGCDGESEEQFTKQTGTRVRL